MTEIPVICIDGPSGSGKGTISHLLARKLGWHLLDSGALYRLVAVGAEREGIPYDDVSSLCRFASAMDVVFSACFEGSIELNGEEISDLIRREDSGEKASLVARVPEVRDALFERQRGFLRPPGLVADGRDMGTTVFPNAPLKFFLTASAQIRAERRYKQLINKGLDVNLRDLLEDIQARDERDSRRKASPLAPADDAIVIDTSDLGVTEVLEKILIKVEECGSLQ